MSLFQGGYLAFLTSIINDAGFVSGDFDLAHWIFGYDRKSNLQVVHLTFLPPSELAGIVTLAHDLMTAEEKMMSGLPRALNVERMEKSKDVKGLIKALRHKDNDVRTAAAVALVRIEEPAVDPLIQALKDENRKVRATVVWALREIGEPAVDPLTQALKHTDSVVRLSAAVALDEPSWKPGDDTARAVQSDNLK